jgi:hypothetical protein
MNANVKNACLYSKGSSINDVMGGGGQGLCDNSIKASVIKSATMWGEGQKRSKIA